MHEYFVTKDVLADLTLQNCSLELYKHKQQIYIDDGLFRPNSPITQVLDYIRQNIEKTSRLKNLSEKLV
jgi:hypothetical protein